MSTSSASSTTPGVGTGGPASVKFNNSVIPPLSCGQRISDWEPVFKAAVTSLLVQTGGERLAIGLLPGYVNRRVAEVELVKEAVKANTLNDAFELLKTLDDHVDPYEAMQKLCRADWYRGVHIDDFYYTQTTISTS